MAYIIGVYWGDASIYKNYIKLRVIDKDFVEEFNRCITKVIGRNDGYSVHRINDGRYRVVCGSKFLSKFLQSPLYEHKHVLEKFPADFLRGVYDSEGSISRLKNKNSWSLKLYNANLELLQYVHDLLERRFAISTNIKLQCKKGYTSFYRGHKATATKNSYHLRTGCRENLLRFYKKIGFSITRKQMGLKRAADAVLEKEKWITKYDTAMELRKEKGWGNERIAKEIGLSYGTVANWIYLGRKPHYYDIIKESEFSRSLLDGGCVFSAKYLMEEGG